MQIYNENAAGALFSLLGDHRHSKLNHNGHSKGHGAFGVQPEHPSLASANEHQQPEMLNRGMHRTQESNETNLQHK
ncbi:hypothetical protein Nepgr_007920 [Nepenthes gracilis]|uniref:Uncharacterized protein n=1 Tax=Nepenthes gracilis TaxID=150966 RepID=A0AAD3S7V8_NEPGR|nr:hypothetical protein Nepgr_007920 [Nepenthes gracilis]